MRTERNRLKWTMCILAVLIMSLLAACQKEATPTLVVPPSPDTVQRTLAAVQAENELLGTQVSALMETLQNPPTPTPTIEVIPSPTSTSTPTPGPTVSVSEDMETANHEAAPGYVFVFDPEMWTLGSTTAAAESFLIYNEVEDCTINIAPGTAPGDLLRYYPQIIDLGSWLVEGYEESDFYVHKDLRLELPISEDDDCILARETVLADVLTQDEFDGAPLSSIAVRPTQRPTPEDFVCEGTQPTRLAVGDRLVITAGFLWLRDEARVDETTEIKLYQQYAPVEITVTAGPECAEGFVFWEVQLIESGEGGETYTGWMAEAGADEYFLDIWYLGW